MSTRSALTEVDPPHLLSRWNRLVLRAQPFQAPLLVATLVAIWMTGWAPNVANLLVRGRVKYNFSTYMLTDTDAAVVTYRLLLALTAALLATTITIALSNRTKRSPTPLVLALLPTVALVVVANAFNHNAVEPQMFLYAAFMVALWSCTPTPIVFQTVAWLGFITALSSLALGLTSLGTVGLESGVTTGKALLFPEFLAGLYSYNNTLGLAILATLPFVFLWRRNALKWSAVGVMLLAIVWTSSRTTLAIAAIAILIYVVLSMPRVSTAVKRIALSTLIIGGALAVALAPFLFMNRPASFSHRGELWHAAYELVLASPFVGYGSDVFLPDQEFATALGTVYPHGHNLMVTVALSSGLLGLLALAALIGYIAVKVVQFSDVSVVPAVALIAMLGTGILETPVNLLPFERVGATSFATWIVFALGILLFEKSRGRKWISAPQGAFGVQVG